MRIHYKINNYTILPQYATIPVDFMVESIFNVTPIGEGGIGGFKLVEEEVTIPYCKDLDSIPNNKPTDWPNFHDVSDWRFITTWDGDTIIGGVAVTGINPDGIGLHHDNRLRSEYRSTGVGKPGVGYNQGAVAINWMVENGCTRVVAQTQNTNVPMCKHLVKYGSHLVGINTMYPIGMPDEVQLVWHGKPPERIKLFPIEDENPQEDWKSNQAVD